MPATQIFDGNMYVFWIVLFFGLGVAGEGGGTWGNRNKNLFWCFFDVVCSRALRAPWGAQGPPNSYFWLLDSILGSNLGPQRALKSTKNSAFSQNFELQWQFCHKLSALDLSLFFSSILSISDRCSPIAHRFLNLLILIEFHRFPSFQLYLIFSDFARLFSLSIGFVIFLQTFIDFHWFPLNFSPTAPTYR